MHSKSCDVWGYIRRSQWKILLLHVVQASQTGKTSSGRSQGSGHLVVKKATISLLHPQKPSLRQKTSICWFQVAPNTSEIKQINEWNAQNKNGGGDGTGRSNGNAAACSRVRRWHREIFGTQDSRQPQVGPAVNIHLLHRPRRKCVNKSEVKQLHRTAKE